MKAPELFLAVLQAGSGGALTAGLCPRCCPSLARAQGGQPAVWQDLGSAVSSVRHVGCQLHAGCGPVSPRDLQVSSVPQVCLVGSSWLGQRQRGTWGGLAVGELVNSSCSGKKNQLVSLRFKGKKLGAGPPQGFQPHLEGGRELSCDGLQALPACGCARGVLCPHSSEVSGFR